MINGHGNDIHQYKKKILGDFSSNVIPGGVSVEIIKHLSAKLTTISNYPEPDAISLQEKISRHHNVNLNNILVTNGSVEAFYLTAQLFYNKKSTIITPSFAEYEDACKINNHAISFLPNTNINRELKFKTNTVWIGNPNNPDGKIISLNDFHHICKNNIETIFIVDEAYAELGLNHESLTEVVNELPNLIITRSLTKCFAIPGIRLGYIITNRFLHKKLMAIKAPWSVNSLAVETGKYIMDNYKKLLPDKNIFISQSTEIQEKINQLDNLEVIKTNCNYFLVKLHNGKASDLKDFLIDKYSLLIRDATNFRGLSNQHIRIATQTNSLNHKLIEGIKEWIQYIS